MGEGDPTQPAPSPGGERAVAAPSLSSAWRWATNGLSLLSVSLFSGIIFGWAPLELMLLEEDQYAELCAPGVPSCADRMGRLDAMFTLAQFALSFASLPVGFFLDWAPKPAHFAAAGSIEVAGLALLAASDSASADHFLGGYALLALGGCMTMLGAFPASFLLPERQAGILAAISCLFDGSSAVFRLFYEARERYGITRRDAFGAWACVAAAVYGALAACWARLERVGWREVVEGGEDRDEEEEEALVGEEESGARTDPYLRRVQGRGLHVLGVARQLRTSEYALAVLFASSQVLRCNFFIMTVDHYLESIGGDAAAAAYYAGLFGWILPCGVLFVPLIEWTLTRWGVLASLHLTNGLGMAFGVLLLVPSLPVQLLNFAIFACFRAYLYAVLNSYVALTFGVETMGRVIGFVFTAAAVVSLAQYPLAAWTESVRGGVFTAANTALALLCAVPAIATVCYERWAVNYNDADAGTTPLNGMATDYRSTTGNGHEEKMLSPLVRRTSLLDGAASALLASPGSPSLGSIGRRHSSS